MEGKIEPPKTHEREILARKVESTKGKERGKKE